jgi:hypothetical protein
MAKAGMPTQIIDGMFNRDTAAQAPRTMMQSAGPPGAIFVGNDNAWGQRNAATLMSTKSQYDLLETSPPQPRPLMGCVP